MLCTDKEGLLTVAPSQKKDRLRLHPPLEFLGSSHSADCKSLSAELSKLFRPGGELEPLPSPEPVVLLKQGPIPSRSQIWASRGWNFRIYAGATVAEGNPRRVPSCASGLERAFGLLLHGPAAV